MEKIKCLLVGESPYNSVNYGPVSMKKEAYPFEVAAFIPKIRTDAEGRRKKEPFEITTYRRIIGFLFNQAFEENTFNDCKLIKEGEERLVRYFAEKGIYFCNIDDLNKKYLKADKSIYKNWEIDESTKIILFGSKAINKYKGSKKLHAIYMPHPSHANNNKIWKSFDGKTNFVNYSTCEEIKNVTKELHEISRE